MGILVVFPIAAAIALLDRKKIENFFFLAIGIIISLIFVAGFVGNTLFGVYAGIILGITAIGYCIYISHVDWPRFRKYVLTQGLFGVSICMVLSGILCFFQSDLGSASDLYRLYAPQIINMYKYNNLGIGVGLTNFELLYNAPICEAWCYFCNKLWLTYSDSVIMWARDIFLISAFAPLFSTIGKNKFKRTLILSFIILTIPNVVEPIHRYLKDVLIAAAASNGIIMTLKLYRERNKYNDKGYLLACCWSLVAICLIKRVGPMFTYGIVSISTVYTIDRLFEKKDKNNNLKKLLPWMLLLVTNVLPIIWHVYVKSYYLEDKVAIVFPLVAYILFTFMGIGSWILLLLIKRKKYICLSEIVIISLITISYVLYKYGVKYKEATIVKEMLLDYSSCIFSRLTFDDSLHMPDMLFILFLVIMISLISTLIKRKKIKSLSSSRDVEITIIPLIFGGIAVVGIILCTYLSNSMLSDDHTKRYLRPAITIILVVFIYELLCIKERFRTTILLSVMIIILLLTPNNIFFSTILFDRGNRWITFSNMYKDADVELNENSRILYQGMDYYGIYASFPAYTDWLDKIPATSSDELTKYIIDNHYDYFVVDECDHNFILNYQNMFEEGKNTIKEHSVYDIKIEGDEVKFLLK